MDDDRIDSGDCTLDRLAILVPTTFDTDEYVYQALKAGATGFLPKDTPRARLLDGIRTAAASQALLAPAVTLRSMAAFPENLWPPLRTASSRPCRRA